ncbi:hypothetical protein HJC23_004549 [Cyclotella cryptica]|uniref:DDE Tnp4 domain-containing protein n=1 Tax=Cyclotella cryptica TaxID=29204 RepID=A0ABD3QB21_9STRA
MDLSMKAFSCEVLTMDSYIAELEADGLITMDSYMTELQAHGLLTVDYYLADVEAELDSEFNEDEEEFVEDPTKEWKLGASNAYEFRFGNVYEANWYRKFLEPSVHERTYHLSSRDRFGDFRCLFRLPLTKADELVSRFVENGWVYETKHCKSEEEMYVRTELFILGALKVLASHAPFSTLKVDTEISFEEHRKFFHLFISRMYSIQDDFIQGPPTLGELKDVMQPYVENFLPGCVGSVDVVHVKWSKCPAGDYNRAKSKERFPSVAFEVVTGYDRRILGWYHDLDWKFFDKYGNECVEHSVYFICDGGYLRWPELVCPYKHEPVASKKGFFSSKIESVRKDVECVFGILKKRWKILDYGIRFSNMQVVEKVFVVCCMLHNFMLSEMESKESDVQVRVSTVVVFLFLVMECGYVVLKDVFHGKTTTGCWRRSGVQEGNA